MAANDRIEPRALSLGHLAVELDADRRTLAKALNAANAQPVATIHGHAHWTVRQALNALAQRAESDRRLRRFQRPVAEPPSWVQVIDSLCATDAERGFALGLMTAIYHAPRIIGGMAAQAGVTMAQAYETSTTATLGLVHVLFEDARRAGIRPFAEGGEEGPEIIATDGFVQLDWRALAEMHGEPDWRPPHFAPGWPDLDAMDDAA